MAFLADFMAFLAENKCFYGVEIRPCTGIHGWSKSLVFKQQRGAMLLQRAVAFYYYTTAAGLCTTSASIATTITTTAATVTTIALQLYCAATGFSLYYCSCYYRSLQQSPGAKVQKSGLFHSSKNKRYTAEIWRILAEFWAFLAEKQRISRLEIRPCTVVH